LTWRLFLRHTCILVSKVRSLRDFQGDSYYDRIDPAALDDPDNPNVVKTVQGNTTYYLVRAEHLPLLQPLRDLTNPIGASFVLDAIEPTLRVFIDMAYDRDTGPGTTTQFSFFTPSKNIVDAFNKLPTAIAEGAHNVENGLAGATPKQSASPEKPASPPVPQPGPTNPGSATTQIPAPEAPTPSVVSLSTAEPPAPPASAKAADPTAISVSTAGASTARDQDFQPDTKPDPKSTPPPTKDSVGEADKSKNTLKPTLRLPKLPVAQPGTAPKSPKFPSLKNHLKSVPGLSEKKNPAADASSKHSQPANAPAHTSDKTSDHASETGRGAA
ncbi:PE-PPE domain-containing protein, partial [Mycobacteroides abscessus subsp. abscessus]